MEIQTLSKGSQNSRVEVFLRNGQRLIGNLIPICYATDSLLIFDGEKFIHLHSGVWRMVKQMQRAF